MRAHNEFLVETSSPDPILTVPTGAGTSSSQFPQGSTLFHTLPHNSSTKFRSRPFHKPLRPTRGQLHACSTTNRPCLACHVIPRRNTNLFEMPMEIIVHQVFFLCTQRTSRIFLRPDPSLFCILLCNSENTKFRTVVVPFCSVLQHVFHVFRCSTQYVHLFPTSYTADFNLLLIFCCVIFATVVLCFLFGSTGNGYFSVHVSHKNFTGTLSRTTELLRNHNF